MSASSRGLMLGTNTPHPLETLLPGPYMDDDFALGICAGLDGVLAPVPVTLDCLDAYFDPQLTPSDFLEWLAGWVGVSLDQNWSEAQRRALVRRAGELYRWQGTVRGIVAHIRLYTGVEPEVSDSGGVSWSTQPGTDLPGSNVPRLDVQVSVGPGTDLDERRLDAIVTAAKPAHVPHTVTVRRQS
jgi:phage tail-like protein